MELFTQKEQEQALKLFRLDREHPDKLSEQQRTKISSLKNLYVKDIVTSTLKKYGEGKPLDKNNKSTVLDVIKKKLTTEGTKGLDISNFQKAQPIGVPAGDASAAFGLAFEALDIISRKLPVAMIPQGEKETVAERLDRDKQLSEVVGLDKPESVAGKVGKFGVDLLGLDLLIPGGAAKKGITKIGKAAESLSDDFIRGIEKATKEVGEEIAPKIVQMEKKTLESLEDFGKAYDDIVAFEKASAKPLDNIEQLGQSALRKDAAFEKMIKKDPDKIKLGRGESVTDDFITQSVREKSIDELRVLDKKHNLGGSLVERKIATDFIDDFDFSFVVDKSGAIDPKLAEMLGHRAAWGRKGRNIKESNRMILEKIEDSLAQAKKTLSPEKFKATKKALENQFGEVIGEGKINPSFAQKFMGAAMETANIPRSFMTSLDLSFGFRQGIFVATRHPKIFFQAFAKQFKMFGSEKYYNKILQEIHERPTFGLMNKGGLSLTELGKKMAKREEGFMSSYAEKIPLAGMIVRASGRAYTGMANRLRADLFDYMLKEGAKVGKVHTLPSGVLSGNEKFLKSAGNFINAATGRGHLPFGLEKAAVQLNSFFFSPRLLASRLHLLNPIYYWKLEPTVRKEALKSLLAFGSMGLTVSGLAKMGGAEIEDDPRNANFMKLKFGNTRYDPLGGFQQPIRAAAQWASGKIISSTTGKEMTLGEGYKPLTRFDIVTRFFEMKEAPLVSFATALMRGQTSIGEKVDIPTEVANRFIPMVVQDMNDLYREHGLEGIPMATPAIFGVGVQTYGGVQTWGLKGSEYPVLNKELSRLKTTMGFPAMSAFGYSLDNSEYKRFKEVGGKKIADNLNELINRKEYKALPDASKKIIIEKFVDFVKKNTKNELFPKKRAKSLIKTKLRKGGVEEDKLEGMIDKMMEKIK